MKKTRESMTGFGKNGCIRVKQSKSNYIYL